MILFLFIVLLFLKAELWRKQLFWGPKTSVVKMQGSLLYVEITWDKCYFVW